jgi:hypothetical protein
VIRPETRSTSAGGEHRLAGLLSVLAGAQAWARTSADSLLRHVRASQLATAPHGSRRAVQGETEVLHQLEDIVYRLLDAHQDTTRLAEGLDWDPEWSEHLDYLRQLQRRTREALSALSEPAEPIVERSR